MIRDLLLKKLLFLTLLTLTALLFFGGSQYVDDRLSKEIWECGHFALFSIAVFSLILFTRLKSNSFKTQFLWTSAFCLVFAIGTETLQHFVGRSFQLSDILNDLIGGYSGLIISQISRHKSTKLNLCLAIVFFFGALLGCRGFVFTLIDEIRIEREFPLLGDFESKLEINRWEIGHARLELSDSFSSSGNSSLRVELTKGKWPRISLEYFKNDWSEYKYLEFDIKTDEPEARPLGLKIYDEEHIYTGYQFDDRFNQIVLLNKGVTRFKIPLEEVQRAPSTRAMRLDQIWTFSLFMEDLQKPYVFYLDNVRLTQ